MDKDAQITQLQTEEAAIKSYLDHPFTKQIVLDNEEQQQSVLSTILELDPVDVASFVSHFVAIGHLRGLRRSKAILMSSLEEVEDKLKELKDNE